MVVRKTGWLRRKSAGPYCRRTPCEKKQLPNGLDLCVLSSVLLMILFALVACKPPDRKPIMMPDSVSIPGAPIADIRFQTDGLEFSPATPSTLPLALFLIDLNAAASRAQFYEIEKLRIRIPAALLELTAAALQPKSRLRARQFMATRSHKFRLAFGSERDILAFGKGTILPTCFILDADRITRFRHDGFIGVADIENAIRDVLGLSA